MKKASEKKENEPDFEEKRLSMPVSEKGLRRVSDSDEEEEVPVAKLSRRESSGRRSIEEPRYRLFA